MKPDVVPPGHAARIISPTFSSGDNPLVIAITKATIGNKIICASNPMRIDFGFTTRPLKF